MKFLSVPLFIILLLYSVNFSFAAEGEIVAGASLALTGSLSEPSIMMSRAYRLWAEEVNQSGGILGRQVKLIIYDNRSDSERVHSDYLRLIDEDNADLLLSPYSTPQTLEAASIAEERGFVMIAAGASGDELWQKGFTGLFGMYTPADKFAVGFLDLCAREGYKQIAVVHENNTFNIDAAAGAVDWAARFGMKAGPVIEIDPFNPNLRAAVKKLLSAAPDGVFVSAYPDIGYSLLKTMNKLGYKPGALAMTIIPIHPEFYEKAGVMAEGVFGPSQWEPMERIPYPGTREFISSFEAFTGAEPSYHAGSAYAACRILTAAVETAGSLDQELLRAYIASLDTVTVIGRFKTDHTGRQVGHTPVLIQWQEGGKEIVYPRSMQTALPRFTSQDHR